MSILLHLVTEQPFSGSISNCTFALDSYDSDAEIRVIDTGIGIPLKELSLRV